MHNCLDRTAIGQQGYHNANQFGGLAQPFQHGSPSRTKGLSTAATPIALPLAIMDTNIALSSLASCATRRIRAKLLRRFHRLWCTLLHKHIMPEAVLFFKLFLSFHRLVGLYRGCQTRTVLSQEAEARCLPSCDQET